MEDVPDDWTAEAVTDANGNPMTYAAKWTASDFAGKREMLKEWKINAWNVVIDGKRSAGVVMVPRWEAWDAEPANGQATGTDPLTQELRQELERISGTTTMPKPIPQPTLKDPDRTAKPVAPTPAKSTSRKT